MSGWGGYLLAGGIFAVASFLAAVAVALVVGPRAYANGRAAGYRDGLTEGERRRNVALLRPPFVAGGGR